MLSFPLQSFVGWKVAVTILHVVTFACTGFRIFHRFKIQRMWFDDYLAILPMLLQIPYLVGFFFRYARYRPPADFKTDQQLRDVTSFGMTVFPCLTIIWAARTMLALSLARLFPPQHRIRRFALGLAVACVLAGISVQVVMLATCDNGAALIKGPSALACKRAGRSTVKDVYLWITDVLSDLFLIGTPLIVFRRIKLARDQRRLLFVVFSGSIATLAISIVFGVISFAKISLGRDGSLLIAGLCHIEATFSLFVANFGVLLTCAYRSVQRARQARAGGAGSAPAEGAAAAGSANNEKTTTAEAPPTTEHRRFHSDGCPCTTDWWASKDGEYPSTLNQTNWSNRNSTDEGKESDEEEGKGTKASK